MRKQNYLSYSALSCFEKDRREYYIRYLADAHPPRPAQTLAMAIGSAFDHIVKTDLGHPCPLSVDPPLVTSAMEWGKRVFDLYKASGALSDLTVLSRRAVAVRAESTLEGTIEGVPLLGKPDLELTVDGMKVILDWKVNGWLSQRAVPNKGYVHTYAPGTKYHGAQHPATCPLRLDCGIMINNASCFSDINETWAAQTSVYNWLWSGELCSPFVSVIHQVLPNRVCTFAGIVSCDYQRSLLRRFQDCWAFSDCANQQWEDEARVLADSGADFLKLCR